MTDIWHFHVTEWCRGPKLSKLLLHLPQWLILMWKNIGGKKIHRIRHLHKVAKHAKLGET